MDIVQFFNRAIGPLKRRVYTMVTRVVLNAIDDSKGIQVVKISGRADEALDGVERFQQYGLTSVPIPGSEGVMVFVGGDSEHPIVLVADNRTVRPSGLAQGDVALYTAKDHMIHLKKGGKFLIKSGSNELFEILENVLTSLGSEPFLTQQALYQAQKAKITSMKGS